MPKPEFSVQKLADRGTATPCVSRTVLQTGDLLQPFFIEDAKKARAVEVAFAVMNHLLACLKVSERFDEEISAGERAVAKGVSLQAGGQVADLPSVVDLQKDFETFLYNAKLALRDTGGLFEVFHGQAFDHRYDKARAWAAAEFGAEAPLVKLLEADAEWIELVFELRNAVEHPRDPRGPLEVRDFGLVDGGNAVAPPRWWRGQDPPQALKDTVLTLQEYLLSFFEDLLCALIGQLPNPMQIQIVEIPEAQRDPAKPIRLRPDLSRLAARIAQQRREQEGEK